jgi:electron transfer flavoprotein beta subunit
MNAALSDRPLIGACVKWVDLRPEIDPLTGAVQTDVRSSGWSAADAAAVETALRLAEAWDGQVVVVCAGPPAADGGLRDLLAAGATRAVRLDLDAVTESSGVATALAGVLRGAAVVVCGEHSVDRGSGSVPAFLAHHLDAAQALGLVDAHPAERGRVLATRRLGSGMAERVEVRSPMVLSVEGSVADLRRAPLSAVLRAADAEITVEPALPAASQVTVGGTAALRPRARALPAPTAERALDRIVALTGALVERNPPRTVEATPDEAADEILAQLRSWGYLE